ncbi:hypothetical protein G7Z17_g302 [Cylindrodendrum hubeiense]|uniref:Clr5 domain-containing protein n=1 Tax=Cylindrodendrum hubeiense TaxID=595255 RepID=A0A9P5LDH9_9HYPO|nr:hypothetical protein G7Z17_g302 [Cylindrodendrum hubeiense]
MPRSRPKPTEDEWLRCKADIRRDYLVRNVTLKELVAKVGELGLTVTKAQLEYQLKKWNFKKNMDESAWLYVAHQLKKRKARESEVIYNGKRLKLSTIENETERHRDRAPFAPFAPGESKNVHKTEIAICTPQALPMEFVWPETLPWFQFQSKYYNLFLGYVKQYRDAEKGDEVSEMPRQLFLPVVTGFCGSNTNDDRISISKLASEIGKSMPESCIGEHLSRASALISRPSLDFFQEHFALMVYSLSNKNWDHSEICKYWKNTEAILRQSGLLRHPIDVASIGNRTTMAFMDNLFQLWGDYVNDCDEWFDCDLEGVTAVLEWLLMCGIDPNTRFAEGTPLLLCIRIQSVRCTRMLLEAGAMDHTEHSNTPLQEALQVYDIFTEGVEEPYEETEAEPEEKMLVDLLIQYSPRSHFDTGLRDAIAIGCVDFVKTLVLKGANLLRDLPESWLSKTPTALCEAASVKKIHSWRGTLGMVKNPEDTLVRFILDTLKTRYPSISVSSLITPDVFISAAEAGNICALQFLCENSSDIATANAYGFTTLHAAAFSGDLRTCEFLLDHQVPVNSPSTYFSALHFAAILNQDRIVDLLINNGADVDAARIFPSPLDIIPGWRPNIHTAVKINITDFHRKHNMSPMEALFELSFQGAAPSSPFEYGAHVASPHSSWSRCLASLVRAGARLSKGAVINAIRCGSVDVVSAVLAADGNPNETYGGSSALEWAASLPRKFKVAAETITESLISAGAVLKGSEAILALHAGNCAVAKLLLNYGASLGGTICDGFTALEAAIRSQEAEAIETVFAYRSDLYDARSLLVLEGPEPPIRNFPDEMYPTEMYRADLEKSFRNPPCLFSSPPALAARLKDEVALGKLCGHGYGLDWYTLVEAAKNNDLSLARRVLESQPSAGALFGRRVHNPLFEAVCNAHLDMVQLLLSAGIRAEGYFPCRTPLQQAVQMGNLALINMLLEAGAKVDEPPYHDGGATSLQLAAIQGYLGIANLLIDHGADVNARRAVANGRTALEGAAEHGRLDMVQFLLCNGLKTSGTRRRQYVRSIWFAKERNNPVVESVLRDHQEWTDEDEKIWLESNLSHNIRCWSDEYSNLDDDNDASEKGRETKSLGQILLQQPQNLGNCGVRGDDPLLAETQIEEVADVVGPDGDDAEEWSGNWQSLFPEMDNVNGPVWDSNW